MKGGAVPDEVEAKLSTPEGLTPISEGFIFPWEGEEYITELSACERMFRATGNPLYIWQAICKLGELRQTCNHLVPPPWILNYLFASAQNIAELQEMEPPNAVDNLLKALGLKAGQGANYFAGLRADKRNGSLARAAAEYRKEMPAHKVNEVLGEQLAMEASNKLKARLTKSGESIGPRSVQRRLASGQRVAKLSTTK